MNDTNETIQNLQTLSNSLRSEGNGKIAQADAIDLGIEQLKGTLETQLLSIRDEQALELPKVKEVISEKDATIADLQEQLKPVDNIKTDEN